MIGFDKKQVMTIPNLLSLLRLLMIPVLVCLYLNGHDTWTALVLILSGVTDVVDGYIARHFNQTSDLGKVLDPIADKLTQAVLLWCLTDRYKVLLVPLILLVVKEIFAGISGLMVINRTGVVPGADWHGKMTTMLLYGLMILHVVWQDIPRWTSNVLTIVCVAIMLISLVLYARRNLREIRSVDGISK